MANEIDERIVEAKFDGAQFEKGVDKTLKKLNELKEALNLKDAGKNVTQFAKEASEGIDKAGNSLEKLQNRLTTFTGMIKQQILSGLANEVSGAILKIEQSVKSLVTSLSSQQMAAGMNKYNEIMTAVRTMTAAGINEGAAYKAIDRLREYSDQTSYSLSQMSSGMSKLVASGMKLESAEKAMEGLANMAASAGVNIYDAQRAFTNFSQAYSSGSMQIRDWVSFENLNMATQPVMKIFMQAAEEVGNLTKSVNKNGEEIYKTTSKINKKVKANKEVSINAFRDSLSFNWLDRQVMERATSVLSYFEELDMDLSKLTDEDLKTFAAKAFAAAKEARSFADVMGTVKDVIATGWATSFEIIFGKLEQAKNFFTWLTESNFAEVIYSIGEFRNAVLTAWGKDFDGTDEGGIFKKGKTGRDFLLASLKNIDAAIGRIHEGLASFGVVEYNETLGRYLTFPEMLGKNLVLLSKRFNKFSVSFYKDVSSMVARLQLIYTEGQNVNGEIIRVLKPEYKEKLQKIADGVGAVAGIISKLAGILNRTVGKVFLRLLPIFDSVGTAIGNALAPLVDLNNNEDFFQNITNAIDNLLIVLQPAIDLLGPVIELAGQLAGVFIDIGIQTAATNIELLADALGFIIELFGGTSAQKANEGVGVIESWKNDIQAFSDTCKEGLGAIKTFFSTLFDDLRRMFGVSDQTEGEEGGFFKGIQDFFTTNDFVLKVKAWLDQAVVDVSNWITSLPDEIQKATKKLATSAKKLWDRIDEFLFGTKVTRVKYDGKQWVSTTDRIKTGFSLWLSQLPKKIGDWFAKVPEKIKAVWDTVDEFLFGKKVTKTKRLPNGSLKETTGRVKEGFSKWLDDTIASVRGWFTNLPATISGLWNDLVTFFFGKEVTVTEVDPTTGVAKETTTRVKEGFSLWLENTIEDVKAWITGIPATISTLWNQIVEFFLGREGTLESNSSQKEGGRDNPYTGRVKEGFSAWLSDTIKSIKQWLTVDAPTAISGLWDSILDAIFGETVTEENAEGIAEEQKKSIVDIADENLKQIGIDIGGLFTNLPTYIAAGITGGIDLVKNLFDHVKNFFANRNKAREEGKQVADLMNADASEIAKKMEDNAEVENPLLTALVSIGQSIGGLVTDTIPGMLSEAFTWVGGEAAGWWESLKTILNLDGFDWGTVQQGANAIGEKIAGFIREIPGVLRTATASLVSLFHKEDPFEKAKAEIDKRFIKDGVIIDRDGYLRALNQAAKTTQNAPKEVGFFDSIKEIGTAIGDAFIDLGPDILDGINKAFTWIGDQITNFTKKLNKRNKDQGFFEWITGMASGGEDGESQIATAVRSLGETIKNIITNVIPQFLGAAFAELSVGIPKFIQMLFGGPDDEKAVEEGTEQFGDNVAKGLKEGLQSTFAANGIESINNDWLGKVFGSVFGISSANAEEFDNQAGEVAEAQEKQKELTEEEAKIQERIFELLDEKRKYEKTINGPDSGKLWSIIFPGDVKPVQEAQEGLATVDKELEELKKEWPNLSFNMEDADSKSINKTDEALGGFMGVLGKLGSFMTSEGGMIIAGLTAFGFVLSQIKDIFSITDEIESFGYSAMWEAIKVAVLGVVGIIGWVSYLSSQADANVEGGRLDNTMKTLETLTSFVERIGGILVHLGEIKLGGTALEALGSFFDWREAKNVAKGAKEAAKEATATGNIFTNLGSNLLTKLSELGLIAIGSDVISGGFETIAESLGAVFADIGLGLDNMMTFLDPAIEKMASMSTNVTTAIAMVDDLIVLINKLNDMVGATEFAEDLNKDIGGVSSGKPLDYNYFDGAIFVANNLQTTLGFISALGATMSSLGKGINEFLSIEDSATKINGLIEFLQTDDFKTLLSTLFETVAEVLPTNLGDTSNLTYVSLGLDMLSNALSIFADGLSGLDQGSIDTLSKALDIFDKLTAIVVESPEANQSVLQKVFSGDNSFSHFGQEIASFGGSLRSFFNNIKHLSGVDESTIDNTERRIDLVVKIAQGLAKTIPDLVAIGDGSAIEVLGEKLGMFGYSIGTFIHAINEDLGDDINMDRLGIINEALSGIGSMMTGIGLMMSGITSPNMIPEYFTNFFKGIADTMVGENSLFTLGLTKGGELDSGLAEGIKGGKAITATEEVVANITSILDVLKTLNLDDDSNPTITPVVDFTDLDAAQKKLDELNQNGNLFKFKTSGLNSFANSANPNAYSFETIDYSGILSEIQSTLSSLGGPMTVKTSLNGVTVRMDTGALVGALIGEIDNRLGRFGMYGEREG